MLTDEGTRPKGTEMLNYDKKELVAEAGKGLIEYLINRGQGARRMPSDYIAEYSEELAVEIFCDNFAPDEYDAMNEDVARSYQETANGVARTACLLAANAADAKWSACRTLLGF